GVEQIFHKVNLKPGKPLWLGTRMTDERTTLVYGLPGNPVSSLVCFELFVRPAIATLAGRSPTGLRESIARLSAEHRQRGERPTYWPARLQASSAGNIVTPLAWKGSGDLRTLTDANCLAFFPAGEKVFARDESITIIYL
ncbi:MAG: molybdopterin-binding protein, partial [Mycobacterium sp.]